MNDPKAYSQALLNAGRLWTPNLASDADGAMIIINAAVAPMGQPSVRPHCARHCRSIGYICTAKNTPWHQVSELGSADLGSQAHGAHATDTAKNSPGDGGLEPHPSRWVSDPGLQPSGEWLHSYF